MLLTRNTIQMQEHKFRQLQQLQQGRFMSLEGVPESQQISQNYSNNPSENNIGYKLELSPQQAAFLTRLLPSPLSFQLQAKPFKRSVSIQKNIRENPKPVPQVKRRNTKEDSKPAVAKNSSGRGQKANNNRYSEEFQNAVYEKYSSQKNFQKNNFDNVSENLKPCVRILNLLKNNKTSWPFREPVDPIALGIPHYTEIIKEPMDLSTVENNLRTNQYVSPTQFHADVSKIITNSYTFNSSDIHFTKATAEFEAYYRKITAEPGSDYNRSYSQHDMAADYSKSSALEMKKSRKQIEQDNSSTPIITMAEKKELGLNIKKLPKEDMKGILDIVKEGTGKIIGEFDLKELDPSIIRKLQTYVKEKMNGDSKIKGMNNDKRNNDNDEESSFEVGEEDDES